MNRWIQNAIGLSATGALCLSGWAAYQLGAAVHENRPALHVATAGAKVALDPNGPDLPTVFNEARDVTIALLKPCKAGKPETCGLIPAAQQVASDTGVAVQTMQTQVASVQPLIRSAASAVTVTAGAAAATAQEARTDLQTLNGVITASQPLLEAYTRSGDSLNAGLQTETADLHKVLIAAAGGTEQLQGIATDGRKVSDHLETEIDHPVKQKWYIRILPTSIRALIAGGQVYSAVR